MGVVVDPDSGATLGIVTLEDVLEEIVGEIADEFDPQQASDFVKDGENFRASGTFSLRELRDKLGLTEEQLEISGDVDTIGGYITQQLARFPRAGDTVDLGPYTARVINTQQRRVTQILITPKSQAQMRADGPGDV
jgi:CBS domain containing-hemolysin-like protein